jgi:hypothetical protein
MSPSGMIRRMDGEAELLLSRIKARAKADGLRLPPVVDQHAIETAQQRLGFKLPPLLAAAYRTVGNGGFGPDYQLLALDGDTSIATAETAVGSYLSRRAENLDADWAWPEGVLPILDWGCAMYACVDCGSDEGVVLLFEPNPGKPELAWYLDSPTLAAWFRHYVDDTGWWLKAEAGGEPDGLPLWPGW